MDNWKLAAVFSISSPADNFPFTSIVKSWQCLLGQQSMHAAVRKGYEQRHRRGETVHEKQIMIFISNHVPSDDLDLVTQNTE